MEKTSDVYEKLYHYTTWDGLLGILQTQTLWATHYRFLNDYSEIVLFRDKLVSLILPYVREGYEKLVKQSPHIELKISQEGGLDQVIQHDAAVVVDTQYRATGDEIYILSFCGQHKNPHINSNGLLSQWRGYGAGGGLALVFNTQKLEEVLEIEAKRFEYSAMHLSDLIYSDDEDRLKKELYKDLSIIADDVKQLFDPAKLSEKEKAGALKSYLAFVNCISRYKHCGFSEENEVRAVVLPVSIDQEYLELARTNAATLRPEKERKFRDKNGQLVPYIELLNSSDIELPIERIIIGPHKEKEARAAALRVMLKNTKIKITCSDIPFVG
ncbi:MAG: DUF2971 domain-containing protein [Thermodesulfovibrionales bacterium]